MDAKTLKLIKRRFNGGAVKGSSARLAEVMGVSLPTLRAWMSDPEDRANYRQMPRSARRLLATMVVLDGAGLLDHKFVAAIDTFDRLLNEGDVRLGRALKALQAVDRTDGGADDEDGEG
ncbi:hypothetical protein MEX01_50440 [Methylorubrum extorquens]|nr:hypothetical protein MEX01_50440 [Methylorubrum extorquens]